jgi:hypothetical protein
MERDKASRLAASLAYYTAFSVAPLAADLDRHRRLLLRRRRGAGAGVRASSRACSAGRRGGHRDGRPELQPEGGAGALATIIGLVTLLWSASNVFGRSRRR